MADNWQALRAELQGWQDAGLTATFWWRDDDAQDESAQLDRLLCMAADLQVSLALAVIPAGASDALAKHLRGMPHIDVLQHGYAHINHAPASEKKMELGAHRATDTVVRELAAGRRRLAASFDTCQPVLVPPWNRIDQRLLGHLGALGIRGVSTSTPRAAAVDRHGLTHVNTHVDPIDWLGGRGFCGEAAALEQVLRHLSARRTGVVDRDEPTGLLTHHLVQDDDCWSFCEHFIDLTSAAGNVAWAAARDLFRSDAVLAKPAD